MKKPQLKFNLQRRLRRKRFFQLVLLMGISLIIIKLMINLMIILPANNLKPVDGILVLGGSIRREIYIAQLANQYGDIPIIISTGSKDPCVLLIFQREQARLNNVWLEKCANSTFENFFYSVPFLKRQGVHKVQVITSPTHLPRAKWLAEIHLNSQGIAVEMQMVKEIGIPGNNETKLKTYLDVTRSLIWGILSQVIHPYCSDIIPLEKVDLKAWEKEGFECEAQGRVEIMNNEQ